MTAQGVASGPKDTTFKVATSVSIDPDRVVKCSNWLELDQNSYPYQNCENKDGQLSQMSWTASWGFGGSPGESYNIRASVFLGTDTVDNVAQVTCD